MNKDLIVSSTPRETKVALLEDGAVAEFFIEREAHRGVVGNIYKGRVSKVLPGMQSAFVDLGLERDAFLYVTDVISPTEEALEDEDDLHAEPPPALEPGAADAPEIDETDRPPTQNQTSDRGDRRAGPGGRRERQPPTTKIEDLLKEGQEIVVQVVKEPL